MREPILFLIPWSEPKESYVDSHGKPGRMHHPARFRIGPGRRIARSESRFRQQMGCVVRIRGMDQKIEVMAMPEKRPWIDAGERHAAQNQKFDFPIDRGQGRSKGAIDLLTPHLFVSRSDSQTGLDRGI
jgi:hypothetical protein